MHRFTIETVKILKYKLLFFILVLLSISSDAQPNLDSLRAVWEDELQADTTRLEALRSFAREKVYNSDQSDSALYYCELMLNFAINKVNKLYQAKAYALLGTEHHVQNNYLKSEENHKFALKISKEIGYKKGIAGALWDLGSVHNRMNKYVLAIEDYSECLVLQREMNDTVGISGVLNNIGGIYQTTRRLQ